MRGSRGRDFEAGDGESAVDVGVDRGYLGQVEDPAGLDELTNRGYDPTLGRFISPDPLSVVTDPESLNPYSYADNNPTTYSDPSGLSCAYPQFAPSDSEGVSCSGGGGGTGGGSGDGSGGGDGGGSGSDEPASHLHGLSYDPSDEVVYVDGSPFEAGSPALAIYENYFYPTATGDTGGGGCGTFSQVSGLCGTGAFLTGHFTWSNAFDAATTLLTFGKLGKGVELGVKGASLGWRGVRAGVSLLSKLGRGDEDEIRLAKYMEGGGHHIPAKSAFRGAPGYSISQALAIPMAEMQRLGIDHVLVTAEQRRLYTGFARAGETLTWGAMQTIETEALVAGGATRTAAADVVSRAIASLQDAGVPGPTRIPWGG